MTNDSASLNVTGDSGLISSTAKSTDSKNDKKSIRKRKLSSERYKTIDEIGEVDMAQFDDFIKHRLRSDSK